MLNHTQKCGKIYGWWYVLCASWIVPASPKLLDFKDTNYVMCALFIELTTGWKRYDNSVTLPPSGLQYVFRQDKATNIVCLFFFVCLFFYMYRLNAVFYLYFIVTYWNFFFKLLSAIVLDFAFIFWVTLCQLISNSCLTVIVTCIDDEVSVGCSQFKDSISALVSH